MTEERKHTPLPWAIISPKEHEPVIAQLESDDERSCDGVRQVCEVAQGRYELLDYDEIKANAEFIVRACNSHYELVETLKIAEGAIDWIRDRVTNEGGLPAIHKHIKKALAKATGEMPPGNGTEEYDNLPPLLKQFPPAK